MHRPLDLSNEVRKVLRFSVPNGVPFFPPRWARRRHRRFQRQRSADLTKAPLPIRFRKHDHAKARLFFGYKGARFSQSITVGHNSDMSYCTSVSRAMPSRIKRACMYVCMYAACMHVCICICICIFPQQSFERGLGASGCGSEFAESRLHAALLSTLLRRLLMMPTAGTGSRRNGGRIRRQAKRIPVRTTADDEADRIIGAGQ